MGEAREESAREGSEHEHEHRPAEAAKQDLAASLAEAAKRSAIGRGASEDADLRTELIASIGGWRGVVEVTLPGLVFLIAYTISQDLVIALIGPIVLSLVFLSIRVLRKEPVSQALGGLIGTALSAGLALWSGRGEDYYVLGFWTNGGYALGLLISVLLGWPIVGVVVGFVMGDQMAWRKDRTKRRVFRWLTLLFAAMFALRLAVQLPLYFAGNVELLGIMRIAMGLPLYAIPLVLTWLVSRALYRSKDAVELS